ncbi:MAG: lytic transglycosylase domain-containing protein [Armatimonadota bacterium]|nr:lytic transglycosylase domain-containing protein [Armatimonadota bacterium]
MLRSLIALTAAFALIGGADADTLNAYIKARKQYGITTATTSRALDTFVGGAVMEIKGQVRGAFTMDGKTSLLLEVPGASPIIVKGGEMPDWIKYPQSHARILVKANRATEFSSIDATVLAFVEEGAMVEWEKGILAAAAKTRPNANTRSPLPKASRGGDTREWNLQPHEAIPVYANFIQGYNPRLTAAKATEIATSLINFSVEFGVDARLITAMVLVESGFNPSARSHAGAMGLGQLMPGTARGLGVRDAYNTNENLWGTVRLIRGHLDKYSNSTIGGGQYDELVLALAAYNAGGGAVKRHNGVPPYKETQNYIKKVTAWYKTLCGE